VYSGIIINIIFKSENRELRRIFGPKIDDVTGGGENYMYIMRSLMICTAHQI